MRVLIAGDSTAAPKLGKKRPETGWGERLGCYFDANTEVINHAHNGESTKSFIDCGRFDALAAALRKDDWLLIQFAHNDEHDKSVQHTDPDGDYRANLARFVRLARSKEAHPVLLTPLVRRKFSDDGTLIDTHSAYTPVIHAVAEKMDVPLVDMKASSERLVVSLGPKGAEAIYDHVEPGECVNYPDGVDDHTHLGPHGAFVIAGLAAAGLRDLDLEPLRSHVVEPHGEPEPESGDGAFPLEQSQFEVSTGQTAAFERADGER